MKKALDKFVENDSSESLVAQKDADGEAINDSLISLAVDMKKLKEVNKEIIKKEIQLKILNEFKAEDKLEGAHPIREAIKTIKEDTKEEPWYKNSYS